MLLKLVKPSDEFFGKKWMPIADRTFAQVKMIQATYSEGDVIGAIERVCFHRFDYAEITSRDVTEFFAFWRAIHLQLEELKKIEENIGEYDYDMDSAGVDKLAKYGMMLSVDGLAGGDMTKWKEIERMPYKDVIVKKMMDADLALFNQRLSKIKMRKKP